LDAVPPRLRESGGTAGSAAGRGHGIRRSINKTLLKDSMIVERSGASGTIARLSSDLKMRAVDDVRR